MLREWAPLNDLFNSLPARAKKGLFHLDVKITCIDVLPEFIALGTNLSLVYWFDRKNKHVTELRCESSNVPITFTKILSTVDYMVACGNKIGNVSIFQIPKSHPESLPENLKPKGKQIEKYIVTGLHDSPITALEWSKNGMKLFSGDKSGRVVLTEIDFYMHICKSVEILNEAYKVVQLSYSSHHLLVSTVYRSVICYKSDKWNISQVGKKDRKVLGNFGGLIVQKGYKPSELFLFCARPGLRFWKADIDGNVENTLLFKDLLTKDSPEIPIINPLPKHLQTLKSQKEPSFGVVLSFDDQFLVTYNSDTVYVLDPQKMIVLATLSHIRGILDIATHKDEIFILEEERSLIRISHRPEPEFSDSFSDVSCNTYLPITTSIKDITQKLQLTGIKRTVAPMVENTFSDNINIYTDETSVMYAEEATASPSDITAQKKFDNIGKQEFSDEILYRKKKSSMKMSSMSLSTISLGSSNSDDFNNPAAMSKTIHAIPGERSQESISQEIESKEKLLADILKLDQVKFSETLKSIHDPSLEKQQINKTGNKLDKEIFKPNIVHSCQSSFKSEIKITDQKKIQNFQFDVHSDENKANQPPFSKSEENIFDKEKILKSDREQKKSSQPPFSKNKVKIPDEQKIQSFQFNSYSKEENSSQHPFPKSEVNISGKERCLSNISSNTKSPGKVKQNLPSVANSKHSNSTSWQGPSSNLSDIPACANIPEQWKLTNIEVRDRKDSTISENSLSDWEVI